MGNSNHDAIVVIPEDLEGEELKERVHHLMRKSNSFELGQALADAGGERQAWVSLLGSKGTKLGTEVSALVSIPAEMGKEGAVEVLRQMGAQTGLIFQGVEWNPGANLMLSGVARYLLDSCEPLVDKAYTAEELMQLLGTAHEPKQ